MRADEAMTSSRVAALVGLGLVAGLFSGLFGVGGGLIIVPALVVALRVEHKLAVGTSLMAIVPACTTGIVSYAVSGSVDWYLGLVLAAGAVVGAQIGSRLLAVLSRRVAQTIFVLFALTMAVQMLIVVPNRDGLMVWSPWRVVGLVALSLVAGTAAGLLGIGGGGIVVPVLMFGFGLSDLVAKGASLVMMLPGVLSGLVGNLRGHRVLVRAGLIIGLSAVVTGPVGSWIAHSIPPKVADILFACYLVFVCVTMTREILRREPEAKR